MNLRVYQVATTNDRSLPSRKWNHCSVSAYSHLDAAYKALNYETHIKQHEDGMFEFENGVFVKVK